jgi:predicted DNA-binding WGR domain protein
MSTDLPEPPVETLPVDRTEVPLGYESPSQVVATEREALVALPGNVHRDPVRLDARIKDPLRLREGLLALHAVVASDYRYKPKDRTAYMAYLRLKREQAGMNAFQAQQAYFDWLVRNDPLAWLALDPVITVHPDRLQFEVFSKDEGAYAVLSVDLTSLELEAEPQYGVTNIDFSDRFAEGVARMRSYRETRLAIGQDAVSLLHQDSGKVLEKQIKLPDAWLRGFLQVQSSSALPVDQFSLAPIDVYNLLRYLRLHADQKGKRRGLRIELTPGERPLLVLEPWETVVPTSADVYRGTAAKVLRVWGRRRLMLLGRMLPFAQSIQVHVLGAGLPSFWVLRSEGVAFTLGLTGFTASNWSQAVNFDLLLPRHAQTSKGVEKVIQHLSNTWRDDAAGVSKATKLRGPELLDALQTGCQQGLVMYDLAHQVYRLRPLTQEPLNLERLQFRSPRERLAHDLLARKGAVKIVSENRIFDAGLELTGKVHVEEDAREYRPQLLLADEGHVSRAECTCNLFRQQGLKAGPCTHLVALRMAWSAEEKRRAAEGHVREVIKAETRTFSKRRADTAEMCQVALDHRRVKIRWGAMGHKPRTQTLQFNTEEDARTAYFGRIDDLIARGYLDATA